LKGLAISRKKKTFSHPKADNDKRIAFSNRIKEYEKEGKTIVYIDESGFSHDMPRSHGYAPCGQRCFGKRDWGAKRRTNVIGALVGKLLLTVCLFESTINTLVF
jgi:hypothetical protein